MNFLIVMLILVIILFRVLLNKYDIKNMKIKNIVLIIDGLVRLLLGTYFISNIYLVAKSSGIEVNKENIAVLLELILLALIIINSIHIFKNMKKGGNKKNIKQDEIYLRALSPKNDVGDEEMQTPIKVLDRVLMDDNVSNIAVTGAYGSGKSSMLKTYFNKTKLEIKPIYVSLASFCKPDEKGITGLIERSILQQIFYQPKYNKLPNSQFKGLSSINRKHSIYILLFIFIWGYAASSSLNIQILSDVKLLDFIFSIKNIKLIYTLNSIFIVGCIFIVYLVIRNIHRFKISALKLEKLEIKTSNEDKSILNEYIAELLYFFEETDYNVVIFEDIDRFKQSTDIFVKLREINILLNKSEQIQRKIRFIYAVKDDLFNGEERTKFFDFIFPLIPIINSNNSELIIKRELKINIPNYEKSIDDSFISNISFYITDMRLLLNIINELVIYYKLLRKDEINLNWLLGLIVYKNKFPKDFELLYKNNGFLYNAFNKEKNTFINIYKATSEKELIEISNEISILKSSIYNSKKELRFIYIYQLKDIIPQLHVILFNTNNPLSLDKFIDDEKLFDNLFLPRKHNYKTINGGSASFNVTLVQIDKRIGGNHSYSEKLKLVQKIESGEIKKLLSKKNQIEEFLEQDINAKIHDLIISYNFNLPFEKYFESTKNNNSFGHIGDYDKELIYYLLENQYINEHYPSYISYFYKGGLTRTDEVFIHSVREGKKEDFNYQLVKCQKILEILNCYEFTKPYILNYILIDYLFNNSVQYLEYIRCFVNQISNEDSYTREFLSNYIRRGNNLSALTRYLAPVWDDYWYYINMEFNDISSEIDNEITFTVFKDLIILLTDSQLIDQNFENSLNNYIISSIKIFDWLNSNYDIACPVLKTLGVIFLALDKQMHDTKLFNFIINNSLYSMTYQNIEIIISFYKFNKVNYSSVLDVDNDNFKSHILVNIKEFVTYVLLEADDVHEYENTSLKLLTNNDLEEIDKYHIISQIEFRITKLNSIAIELWVYLFEFDKVYISWENINDFLVKIGDSINVIINVLNKTDVLKLLIATDSTSLTFDSYKLIIQSDELIDDNYLKLVEKFDYMFDDQSYNNLSTTKISHLIRLEKIEYSSVNFQTIRDIDASLLEVYIENNITHYVSDRSIINCSVDALISVFSNDNIDDVNKWNILDSIDYNLYVNSSLNDSILEYLISTSVKNIPPLPLLELLCLNIKTKDLLIQMIIKYIPKLTTKTIQDLLVIVDLDYKSLFDVNKNHAVFKNEINTSLLNTLKNKQVISTVSIQGNLLRVYHKEK